MRKCIAVFDGFVGFGGQAVHVIGSSEWPVEHDLVKAMPELFRYPEGGDPREEPAKSGLSVTESPVQPDAQKTTPAEVSEAPAASPVVDDDGQELPPYSQWTYADLQRECVARNLAKSGTKADLVARLEADDEEQEVQP